MNKKTNLIIGGLLVALGIVFGILGTTLSDKFIIHKQITTTNMMTIEDYLSEVISENSYYYQNTDLLETGALTGMVDSLGDPYSTYFSLEQYNDFNNQLNETLYGVGIILSINGSYPIITYVVPNSPADNAGLAIGQTIKKIDDLDIKDKGIPEIISLIKGTAGITRKFAIYTDNPIVLRTINVTIAQLNTTTISYDYLNLSNDKVGYLKIDSFMLPTYDEFVAAIQHLESKNIDDLIVDVRGNPGGLLSSVRSILDYFINTSEPFMYSESKDKIDTPYYLDQNDHEINYNVVVLMDENSASAAEIFASTMHELGNFELIGTTTFGKGTMQSTFPLNITGTKTVKLTTDIWLTANKEWIHHIGVTPTIEVEQTNFNDLSYIDATLEYSYDTVSPEIKDIQVFLNRKSFTTRMDGYFDTNTLNAVKAYQAMNDLNQTGIVDSKTAYQMNIDMINYLNNKNFDNQYQEAMDYVIS